MKQAAIGGSMIGAPNTTLNNALEAHENGKFDIGTCKRVRVRCVSELGWFDSDKLMSQMKAAGGPETNQWIIPWDPNNAAGSCTLIDMETQEGGHHKFLLDTGWNHHYMDECFKREGIDSMLKKGEIECLIISHEHLDHLWGLETVLKYNPEIKIIIPATFSSEGMHFLRGAEFLRPRASNRIPHQGELVLSEPGKINKLFDGCALVAFDLPIILGIRGEQSLYFHVKDHGIVCVTGCCHQSIITFAEFAQEKILGGDTLYGLYGGLHIAPFGQMNPERESIVQGMGKFHFKKIACNHCTGLVAVQKMIELGYPIVRGSGKHRSQSPLYVGNGDEIIFG